MTDSRTSFLLITSNLIPIPSLESDNFEARILTESDSHQVFSPELVFNSNPSIVKLLLVYSPFLRDVDTTIVYKQPPNLSELISTESD